MSEFKQQTIDLSIGNPVGRIKVSKLLTLIENHPYKENIIKELQVDDLKDDFITIGNVDSAFSFIKNANEKYEKIKAIAQLKDVDIKTRYEDDKPIVALYFEQCRIDDELKEDLLAEVIYDSKATFFDDYKMSKYANFLLDSGFPDLVHQNVQHFKSLAQKDNSYNKNKSYRLLNEEGEYYLRGITSEKYNEYGIDFTFFVMMILLHKKMKYEKGNNYSIDFLALSESKIDFVVKDNNVKTVENFGTVSHGISVGTNELGNGSLNITSVITVEAKNQTLAYLLPKDKPELKTKFEIYHNVVLKTVLSKIKEFQNILTISEDTIKDIKDIKGIKHPDELRAKIQERIEHPKSIYRNIHALRDIFSKPIINDIDNFSTLLKLCGEVEKLDIDYDIKGKLRYVISDIILYGNAR